MDIPAGIFKKNPREQSESSFTPDLGSSMIDFFSTPVYTCMVGYNASLSVCLDVCLGLGKLRCVPLQRYRATLSV